MGNKEASKSINRKIFELRESPTQPCIYKAHKKYIHKANDKVFEPVTISIGPYHRGKQGLMAMEEHKVRYLQSLLRRKDEDVEKYISAAAEMEQQARSCYAEDVDLTAAEFIEMLVLDACFIVELLSRSSNFRDAPSHDDPIFEMKWFRDILIRDLIAFENQIPMFVLCKMFDLIEGPNQHDNLKNLICQFMGSEATNTNLQEVKHLLHLLLHLIHNNEIPADDANINVLDNDQVQRMELIPTATDLKGANVRFRKSEGNNPFELHFENGVLTVAPFTINDRTEKSFRNLVVYEQYFPDYKPTYVTDFVLMFDCLINTERDVDILSECGIIQNRVGDNQVAADIINRLSHSLLLSETSFIYGKTFNRINAHYKKRWNRARAALNRDYFNTPWAYISFVAAVILLVLTLLQTVFSGLQLSSQD